MIRILGYDEIFNLSSLGHYQCQLLPGRVEVHDLHHSAVGSGVHDPSPYQCYHEGSHVASTVLDYIATLCPRQLFNVNYTRSDSS